MDKSNIHLWVCHYFAPELRAAIAGVPEMERTLTHTFPACCGCPALPIDAVRTQIAALPAEAPIVWIGGICLEPLRRKLSDERCFQFHHLKQCFHLVADPDWVDAQLREGAYLCTPGWLADWPNHLARLGLETPELARSLFGESIQRLVLLDTGQDQHAPERLAAFAAHVDRPAATVWVGLGYLRLRLIGLVERLNGDAERQCAAALLIDARQQASEAVMAMDWLGKLSTAQHQSEAIIQLLDMLNALFAPQELFYVPVENGQSQPPVAAQPLSEAKLIAVDRFIAGHAAYAGTDSPEGFLLRVRHGTETLGVFGIAGFALPQYARQYLNLALHMAGLCGLALTRARAGELLRMSEMRYRTLFSSMQEGFALHEIICDEAGRPVDYRFFDMNPAFERLTGLKREQLIGHTVREVLPGTEDYWIERYGAVALTGAAQRFENFSGELDRHYDVYVYSPTPGWFAVIFTDITRRKQTEKHIHHLAHYDALTNLPNRTLLAERTALALALAARRRESLALLFCDLDHFKEINDSLGHGAGDALLAQVAVRFKAALRETDTVARLGGDEFVVLLPEASRDEAALVAEKMQAVLRDPIELAGHRLTISGSIGICLYPQDGASFSELLQNADAAMYRAKQGGRRQFRFYDARMNADMLERLTLLSELDAAIHAGQLCTCFQPKVFLADGRLMGAEALVRWRHP